ncbi:hypothetical protein GCM10027174_21580 [Salinifilum aidingensis]
MMGVSTRSAVGTGRFRIVLASLVGTTVEWYDFFLYGSAAALVFNQLFFPAGDALTGTLLAFVTYAVGFVARPLGGLVFGHYGDRLGRKRLLVLSLTLMGLSSCLIGLVPTYQAIGVAAPIALTVLRLVQGFAIGGEWGGAVLIVSEHEGAKHRGFWASWPQCGVPLGNLLAVAVLAVLAAVQSEQAFLAWGWRVAFLLSGALVLIGLWVRFSIDESPVFRQAQEEARATGAEAKPPVLEVLRRYRGAVLTAMGARFAENVVYYVLTSFVLTYVVTHLELPRAMALNASLIAAVIHFVTIPGVGRAVRPGGAPPRVPVRRGRHRGVGLRLLRPAGHGVVRADEPGDHRGAGAARRDVRTAGGVLLRAVRHAGALLGRLDRLPAGLDRGRLAGTGHRHRAAARVRLVRADRRLPRRVRPGHRGDSAAVRRDAGPRPDRGPRAVTRAAGAAGTRLRGELA